MASILQEANGRKRVEIALNGERKRICLGKWPMHTANGFKLNLEKLLAAREANVADPKVEEWLAGLDDDLHEKLSALGLCRPRDLSAMALGSFLDAYIAGRVDAKPGTITNHKAARTELVGYFGAERLLRDVTEADAEDFFQWMRSDRRPAGKLGVNTCRRVIGRAKQFFEYARRKRLVHSNPFEAMKCQVGSSPERQRFIPADDVGAIMKQIADVEFRAIVALARWGGLRIPSEIAPMVWGDVTWGTDETPGRLVVRQPKLEHIEGKDVRIIPLFPEVEKALLDLYNQTPEGQVYVFSRHRSPTANLRTQFERYILKAGLQPWPKLWQNLRASRATELAGKVPGHLATAWMGHTREIAERHYWQVRDEDYAAAIAAMGMGNEPKAGQSEGKAEGKNEGETGENPSPRQPAPRCAKSRRAQEEAVTTGKSEHHAAGRNGAEHRARIPEYPRQDSNL